MRSCRVVGEQGDPLMPALCALGQHAALTQVHATLRQGEMLFAYLDDIYVLCDLSRVRDFPPGQAVALQVSWHPS